MFNSIHIQLFSFDLNCLKYRQRSQETINCCDNKDQKLLTFNFERVTKIKYQLKDFGTHVLQQKKGISTIDDLQIEKAIKLRGKSFVSIITR